MIICPNCEIEYDRREMTCGVCGSPLVAREETVPEPDGTLRKKGDIQICPTCKMLYEKGDRCLRCGTSLTKPTSPPGNREPKAVKETETKGVPEAQPYSKETEALPKAGDWPRSDLSNGGKPVGEENRLRELMTRGSSPRYSEPKVGSAFNTENDPTRSSSLRQVFGNRHDDFFGLERHERRTGKSIPAFPIVIGGVMALIIVFGYFLMDSSVTLFPSSKTAVRTIPIAFSTVPPSPQAEDRAIAEIKELLEHIRQANLQENIDLLLSCYARGFKNLQEKRRATLESWKQFDYIDLLYDLKVLNVSDGAAHIRVEWRVKATPTVNEPAKEATFVVEATLKKERGGWKIRETKNLS